uniref:CRAL/TRIO N-terminal domain-containing protein n=1 Tax=Aegilops tauschii subsp. strangulata TaxID=200361 RepID=A0A453IM36_AEGTS
MAKVAAMAMEKVDAKDREKIEAVRKVMRKQAPLSPKQAEYCNDACVERFLRAKGDNVKKAAKTLRAVLSWRETIGADHIIADEFSGELSEGMAYVAGHDDENRPVLVPRLLQLGIDVWSETGLALTVRIFDFLADVQNQAG